MIGHRSRFRENDGLPLRVGMGNAIIENDLRTVARKFYNTDFFLKILLLRDDELVMS